MPDDKKWALAWAKFDSMHKNLPSSVNEQTVADFHSILHLLQEASGEDLSTFQISDSRVAPRITSFSYATGRNTFSATRYCDRNYFITQMDAIRGYFQNLQPPQSGNRIGF